MSKLGILSMQRIKNYGSFLQAYALKKILEEIGHEVEFVDYHIEKPVITNEKKIKKGKLNKVLKILLGKEPLKQKIQYLVHKKNFGKKYYKILEITNEPNYNPELDTLIIGSDEVFNCIQENENVGYSLELFGKNNKAKRLITYAASFGNTTIDKLKKYKKKDEIKELLLKFDAISVRDKNSRNIVEELTNAKVEYHLDPVLAYDYMKCEPIPKINVKEKYIIVYAYSGRISSNESNYIRQYAKKNKIKVYAIGGAQRCADKFIDCTPFEVLSYFKNAEFVITDTFHGSIFSIITKRNFITLARKSIGTSYGNEEKLTDLLSRLKLESRLVYDLSNIENQVKKSINYNEIYDIIERERENTRKYLISNAK